MVTTDGSHFAYFLSFERHKHKKQDPRAKKMNYNE